MKGLPSSILSFMADHCMLRPIRKCIVEGRLHMHVFLDNVCPRRVLLEHASNSRGRGTLLMGLLMSSKPPMDFLDTFGSDIELGRETPRLPA